MTSRWRGSDTPGRTSAFRGVFCGADIPDNSRLPGPVVVTGREATASADDRRAAVVTVGDGREWRVPPTVWSTHDLDPAWTVGCRYERRGVWGTSWERAVTRREGDGRNTGPSNDGFTRGRSPITDRQSARTVADESLSREVETLPKYSLVRKRCTHDPSETDPASPHSCHSTCEFGDGSCV